MKKTATLFFIFILTAFAVHTQEISRLLTDNKGQRYLYSVRIEEELQDGTKRVEEEFSAKSGHEGFSLQDITFFADGKYDGYFPSFRFGAKDGARWKLLDDKKLEISNAYYEDEKEITTWEIVEITDSKLILKSPTGIENGLKADTFYTFCYPDTRLSKEEVEKLNSKLFPYKPLNEDLESLSVFEPNEKSAKIARQYLIKKYIYNSVFVNYPTYTSFPFDLYDIVKFNPEGISSVKVTVTNPKSNYSNILSASFDNEQNMTTVNYSDDGEERNVKIMYEQNVPRKISDKNHESTCFVKDNYFLINDSEYMILNYYETDNNLRPVKTRFWWDGMTRIDTKSTYFDTRSQTLDIAEFANVHNDRPVIHQFRYTNNGNIPFDIIQTRNGEQEFQRYQYSVSEKNNRIKIDIYRIVIYIDDKIGLEDQGKYLIELNEKRNIEKIRYFEKKEYEEKEVSVWNFEYH